jgi:hypothetical protein
MCGFARIQFTSSLYPLGVASRNTIWKSKSIMFFVARILSLNSLHTSDRSDRWYSIETTAWINSRPGMATTTGSGTTLLYAVFRVAVGSPRLPTIQAAINTFAFSTKEPSIPLRDTTLLHSAMISFWISQTEWWLIRHITSPFHNHLERKEKNSFLFSP